MKLEFRNKRINSLSFDNKKSEDIYKSLNIYCIGLYKYNLKDKLKNFSLKKTNFLKNPVKKTGKKNPVTENA